MSWRPWFESESSFERLLFGLSACFAALIMKLQASTPICARLRGEVSWPEVRHGKKVSVDAIVCFFSLP